MNRRTFLGALVGGLSIWRRPAWAREATPTASPSPADYPALARPGDLWNRPRDLRGKRFAIVGKVGIVQVAEPGSYIPLAGERYRSVMMIIVARSFLRHDAVTVVSHDPITGVKENDVVEVGGTLTGDIGGIPLVEAEYVRLAVR